MTFLQVGGRPLDPEDTTTANDAIALSYGLGWGLLESPYGRGAFKEGHADGFEHYSIVFPDRGLGVVIMTNSANGESIFKELLELTIADTYTPWEWENYVPFAERSNDELGDWTVSEHGETPRTTPRPCGRGPRTA